MCSPSAYGGRSLNHAKCVGRTVEEHEKHRVKHRDLDLQFDHNGEPIDGSSEVDEIGQRLGLFEFCAGMHH